MAASCPSGPAISRIRTCRQIVDRIGQSHATGPTLKRLQFRKAADRRRNACKLHGLAAIRAAMRVCSCVHSFVFCYPTDCIALGDNSNDYCLLMRSTLESFEIGNHV